MNIGDRVRIVPGQHFYGPPEFMMGQEGAVVGYDTNATHLPGTVVRLDSGEEWTFYEDEMELVSPAGVTPLGPQEPPGDPMIYNRRQADGTFRSLAGFWERDEALRQQEEKTE